VNAFQSAESNPKVLPKDIAKPTTTVQPELSPDLEVKRPKYENSLLQEYARLRDQMIEVDLESNAERLLAQQIESLEEKIAGQGLITEARILSLLTERRVGLIIDIAGLKAKLEYSLKSSEEQSAKRSPLIQEIIDAQVRVVELTQAKLKAIEQKGSIKVEMADAQREVATAELRLLEKKRELEKPAQIDAQAEIGLELAEKKSQLETVDELLDKALSIRDSVAKLDELKGRLNQIKSSRFYGISETWKELEKKFAAMKLQQIIQEIDEGIQGHDDKVQE
jgi:hypothetical protein